MYTYTKTCVSVYVCTQASELCRASKWFNVLTLSKIFIMYSKMSKLKSEHLSIVTSHTVFL